MKMKEIYRKNGEKKIAERENFKIKWFLEKEKKQRKKEYEETHYIVLQKKKKEKNIIK